MKCANCQAELAPTDSFCSECGQRVTQSAAPTREPVLAAAGELRRFEGHQKDVVKVAFTADGREIRSVDSDGVIHMWDVDSGRRLRRVINDGVTTAVALSSDGRRALAFCGGMRIWDLDSAQQIQHLAHRGYVLAAALSRDGRRALFDGDNDEVVVWDVDGGRELQRLPGHSGPLQCLAFSADGRYAMSGAMESGTTNPAVLQWDLQTGRRLPSPERQMELIACLAFSPDARRAAGGTLDAGVFMWEFESGYELHRYEGHTGNVLAIAFTPDGKRLATGSGSDDFDDDTLKDLGVDNTIRLWDTERQRELHRFEGHAGNVTCIAFSSDGRTLLSGSTDKTVRLWRLPT